MARVIFQPTDPEAEMRNLLFIPMIALLLGTSQSRATEPAYAPLTDEAELIEIAHQLIDAQRRFDTAYMEIALDESYVEISPIGAEDHRADVLGFYGSKAKEAHARRGGEAPSIVLEETLATVSGTQGRLTAREVLIIDGTRRALRLTLHFRKTNLGWRILTAQYTPIREPRP